jgi:hypothetical protein
VSRIALLLAALLALGCLAGAADARPRKPRKVRGHASAVAAVLPGAPAAITRPGEAAVTPGGPATPGTEAPPLPPPPPPPTGTGRSVQVTTDDADPDAMRLVLSRTTVLAGSVKVTFNNAFAQDPHNLVLEGPGDAVIFPELPKGEVAVRTAPLAAGTWKLSCGLEGHEARGMVAQLTVAPA